MSNFSELILYILPIFFILSDAQFWSSAWNNFNVAPRNTGWRQQTRGFFRGDDNDDDNWGRRGWRQTQNSLIRRRNFWSDDRDDDDDNNWGRRGLRQTQNSFIRRRNFWSDDRDDDDDRRRRWSQNRRRTLRSRSFSDDDDDRRRGIFSRRRSWRDDSDDEDDNRFRFARQLQTSRGFGRTQSSAGFGNSLCSYYLRRRNSAGILMYCRD